MVTIVRPFPRQMTPSLWRFFALPSPLSSRRPREGPEPAAGRTFQFLGANWRKYRLLSKADSAASNIRKLSPNQNLWTTTPPSSRNEKLKQKQPKSWIDYHHNIIIRVNAL